MFDSVKIPVGKSGEYAVIDMCDLENVLNYTWSLSGKRIKYAKSHKTRKTGGKCVWMHRAILGEPPPGHLIDHINGNGLDNRRKNLRFATQSQNRMNSAGKALCRSSPFKGMTILPTGLWQAQVTVGGKTNHVGNWHTTEAAALSYNCNVKKHHSEFSWFNTIPKTRQQIIEAELLAASTASGPHSLRNAIKKFRKWVYVSGEEIAEALQNTGVHLCGKIL